jgi:hypothetical protein
MMDLDNMCELNLALNRCLELLEESVGTCTDQQLLSLLEETYTVIEQLCSTLENYVEGEG